MDRDAYIELLKAMIRSWEKQFKDSSSALWSDELTCLIEKTRKFLKKEFKVDFG